MNFRQDAAHRVQGWSPFDEVPEDSTEAAKYHAVARLINSTFTSPAGRKTLDYLIGAYLIRESRPATEVDAAFEAGCAHVVSQILKQMHTAKEKTSE